MSIKRKNLAFLFLLVLAPSSGQARDFSVPGDFSTISQAIEAARAGDRVVVRPGRYHEQLVMKEGVAVVSYASEGGNEKIDGPGQKKVLKRAAGTIIDGEDLPAKPMVSFPAGITRRTVLDGFTITGMPPVDHTRPGHAHTVECRGSSPVIRNNIIYDNGSTGIGSHGTFKGRDFRKEDLRLTAAPLIENNVVYENVGAGIGNNHYSRATIINNEVFGQISEDNHPAPGIGVQHGASPLIKGNIIYENDWVGIGIKKGSDLIIKENIIKNNRRAGIGIDSSSRVILDNNKIMYNGKQGFLEKIKSIFHSDMSGVGVGIMNSTAVSLNNNFIGHNNRPGVAVIKQSKGIILEGNQIVENGLAGTANLAVLQGSRVSLVNNRVVKGDKVNIYVNGSEATLLKNGIKESGAHGLYFIASTGLLEDNTITSSDHYGIKLEKGSQVTIKGNKISGSGRWGGSGVGVEDSAADFQGNQIFNQQSRAPGFSAWGKNTRVTLTNNKLIGTGCKISENADAFLEGNHITHNLKAEEIGVEISSGARAVLLFNLIARHGRKGIMVEEAEATILNNNILENALGIEIDYPVKALIQNNIIMKNRSGGIECDGTAENLTLSHNNVWGNTNRPNRPKILGFLPEPSLKERNYIDCPPGRESISADPQFVNYQKSDYNLRKSSPCLKTGGSSRISHKLASKPNIGIRQ